MSRHGGRRGDDTATEGGVVTGVCVCVYVYCIARIRRGGGTMYYRAPIIVARGSF